MHDFEVQSHDVITHIYLFPCIILIILLFLLQYSLTPPILILGKNDPFGLETPIIGLSSKVNQTPVHRLLGTCCALWNYRVSWLELRTGCQRRSPAELQSPLSSSGMWPALKHQAWPWDDTYNLSHLFCLSEDLAIYVSYPVKFTF